MSKKFKYVSKIITCYLNKNVRVQSSAMLECIDMFQQETLTWVHWHVWTLQRHGRNVYQTSLQSLSLAIWLKPRKLNFPSLYKVWLKIRWASCRWYAYRNSTPKISKAAWFQKEESLGWTSLRFLELVVEYELFDSVPNFTLALKFVLTLCVYVVSHERSISKLKLIKNYLRSTINQAWLSSLAILSTENNLAKGIDFDVVISKFAQQKVRKKIF